MYTLTEPTEFKQRTEAKRGPDYYNYTLIDSVMRQTDKDDVAGELNVDWVFSVMV